jgi:hypothetical protein
VSEPAERAARATTSRAVLAGCLALSVSCAGPPAAAPVLPWPPADPRVEASLRAVLESERDGRPKAPWAGVLRFSMREPRSGRKVDGRGAVAVSPGQAVRMILVGGPGSTVLDAWVAGDRWRVSVPPLGVVRRGGTEEPADLPVGFLRWWFLAPLAGTLVGAEVTSSGSRWLLREGQGVVELRSGCCPGGHLLSAVRRVAGRAERVEECRLGAGPGPGDWARYVDESSGLRVDTELESVSASAPDGDAFRDPDGPAR